MKTELAYFDVYPKVVQSGVETVIHIESLGRHTDFTGGQAYEVRVFPMNESSKFAQGRSDCITAVAEQKALTFSYAFVGEQQYTLYVKRSDSRKDFSVNVYSVLPDLYALTPYMGDLHVHSHLSDGNEAPEFVAACYRRAGFDFMAITDHGRYFPSIEAIDAYRNVSIDLKLFPGEEVHVPYNPAHVVNFGGSFSVNELFQKNPARVRDEIEVLRRGMAIPEDVDSFSYASCCWAFQKIREGGGLAIFPHPFWIEDNAYHIPDNMLRLLFANKPFDAFELIGGQTLSENMMQVAAYVQARADGTDFPVVGSSDSHGVINAEWFGVGRTIAFARTNEREDIVLSIRNSMSVALETYAGEAQSRVYGSFRLVRFAEFLLSAYFPLHDDLCDEEGRLMKQYINRCPDAGAALERLHGQTKRLIGKYWGR